MVDVDRGQGPLHAVIDIRKIGLCLSDESTIRSGVHNIQPLEVAETQSNFILFGGHFDDRDRIFDELLKRGVLIRVVGPEGWMRVCMGTDEEMARFREALVEVLRIVEQG